MSPVLKPVLGTTLLGFSIGRGSGALEGLTNVAGFETSFGDNIYLDLV